MLSISIPLQFLTESILSDKRNQAFERSFVSENIKTIMFANIFGYKCSWYNSIYYILHLFFGKWNQYYKYCLCINKYAVLFLDWFVHINYMYVSF
jgi:hypothetical protein